jgi:hypothetical protein
MHDGVAELAAGHARPATALSVLRAATAEAHERLHRYDFFAPLLGRRADRAT